MEPLKWYEGLSELPPFRIVNRLKQAWCFVVGHDERYTHPQQQRCICRRCNDIIQREIM